MAFFGLLRKDDILRITTDMVYIDPENDYVDISLRNGSKTNGSKERSEAIRIWCSGHRISNLAMNLREMETRMNLRDDPNLPYFRTMQPKTMRITQRGFSDSGLTARVRDLADRAKLVNPSKRTIHGLRRGGAQSLASIGIPERAIRKLGRWKSDAINRYLQNMEELDANTSTIRKALLSIKWNDKYPVQEKKVVPKDSAVAWSDPNVKPGLAVMPLKLNPTPTKPAALPSATTPLPSAQIPLLSAQTPLPSAYPLSETSNSNGKEEDLDAYLDNLMNEFEITPESMDLDDVSLQDIFPEPEPEQVPVPQVDVSDVMTRIRARIAQFQHVSSTGPTIV
jgi:hypothetical protein